MNKNNDIPSTIAEKKAIAALRVYLQKKIKVSFNSLSLKKDYEYIHGLYIQYPKNPSALIARGYLEWRFGNKANGELLFERAFKIAKDTGYELKGREIGVNTYLGTSFTDECIIGTQPKFPDFNHVRVATAENSIILAACDEIYFQKFGRAFTDTCLKHSKGAVHIHVINPSQDTLDFFKQIEDARVSFSTEKTEVKRRFYYASSRFLIAPFILDAYDDVNVLILDIDAIVARNVDSLIRALANEPEDVFVPTMTHAWNPWNYHLAGTVLLKNNPLMKEFFRHFSTYYDKAAQRLDANDNAWWIDQNSLYRAILLLEKNGGQAGNVKKYGTIVTGPQNLGKDEFSKLLNLYNDNIDFSGKATTDGNDEFLAVLTPLLKHKGLAAMFLESFYDSCK